MHADADGKVRGQYPAENGKVAPFESYRIPCTRDLYYYGKDPDPDLDLGEGAAGSLHFSKPVLTGKYNFSAVMHWHAHDYPMIYAASLKKANHSHSREAIRQVSAFIAQQDPMDLRMGVHLCEQQQAYSSSRSRLPLIPPHLVAHRQSGHGDDRRSGDADQAHLRDFSPNDVLSHQQLRRPRAGLRLLDVGDRNGAGIHRESGALHAVEQHAGQVHGELRARSLRLRLDALGYARGRCRAAESLQAALVCVVLLL